jgi:hypothetical protein
MAAAALLSWNQDQELCARSAGANLRSTRGRQQREV